MTARNLLNGGYQAKDIASKYAGARCKMKAIHNAFGTNDLERMKVSDFRDFPLDGKNAEGTSIQVATSAASTCMGFKSIFIDSQALDFCFEGRIGDA